EPAHDARQVADAVAVAVLKRSRVDLVDHAPAPPLAHVPLRRSCPITHGTGRDEKSNRMCRQRLAADAGSTPACGPRPHRPRPGAPPAAIGRVDSPASRCYRQSISRGLGRRIPRCRFDHPGPCLALHLGGVMFSVERRDFGPNFIFGTATASYQIEGGQGDGRGISIWDTFAQTPGNVKGGATGAVADDHYNRWPEDLDLLRDGGFDGYRFSFAWPRLIPEGTGEVNQAGVDFYDRLIDGMLERGIKPFATIYHWDLPSPLQ